MIEAEQSQLKSSNRRQQILSARWERLCAQFLPVAPENSIWRFSRQAAPDDPPQGWKLHISATILTANKILERVGPFLSESGLLYKAPRNLQELGRLNCGLFYGFSQVGKFITVYPQSQQEAILVAQKLSCLTKRTFAPAVPYDRPFQNSKCIFYRYGAFAGVDEIVNPDRTRTPAIRNLDGELVADQRSPDTAVPNWLTDPFPRAHRPRRTASVSLLKTTFRAFEALSQRGKGGVYRALDLSVSPARLCVLKEGRRHGETDWDGRDGFWRVDHEGAVLSALSAAGVRVPKVYFTFQSVSHYYLVTEFIEGQNLQSLLSKKGKQISDPKALQVGHRITVMLGQIHAAGWVWRDCKPLNFVISNDGSLRPIDFEGACPIDRPDLLPWGTEGYVAPEFRTVPESGSRLPEDLYALGVTLQQLLSVRKAKPGPPTNDQKLRPRIPLAVKNLVSALLDPNPHSRPSARVAAQILRRALDEVSAGRVRKPTKTTTKSRGNRAAGKAPGLPASAEQRLGRQRH
jgi:hypothetical protein